MSDLSAQVPVPGVPQQVAAPLPTPDEQTSLVTQPENLVVIARNPQEMAAAQASLVGWAERKIFAVAEEIQDFETNIGIAKANHWGTSALERALSRSRKMLEYYRKIKAALEAGYCIVPNFPVEVFAVRTTRNNPPRQLVHISADVSVKTNAPPLGEGQYVDDAPLGHEVKKVVQNQYDPNKTEERRFWTSTTFAPDIDFPFSLASPEVLDETAKAMLLKVFDDLGVLPTSARRKSDPMVIGRIKDPRSTTDDQRWVSFLVTWFVDTRAL
jgi:hypothetical protein